MGKIKKQYQFKGLDLRSSNINRVDGSSSSCMNVKLDELRNLIKINDMDQQTLNRGTLSSEIGDFETKLHLDMKIIDLIPYEDYFVVVTIFRHEPVAGTYKDVNKFYKWDPLLPTAVTFIPFECEVYDSAVIGQTLYRNGGDIDGGMYYENIENILYFSGSFYPKYANVTDASYDSDDEKYNRTLVFTYDGKVIGRAGCPSLTKNTTTDLGTLVSTEYVATLPLKIDDLGRHTFGNYSVHLGTQRNDVSGNSFIGISPLPTETTYDHQCFLKLASGLNLLSSDSVAVRTISATFYSREATYKSAGKGQYMYGLDRNYFTILTPFGAPTNTAIADSVLKIYRCTIEAIDYTLNTATLGEFKSYNSTTGKWEDSSSFKHTTVVGTDTYPETPPFLSNVITAVYSSLYFTYGYTLKGLTILVDDTNLNKYEYATTVGNVNVLPPNGGAISRSFSDIFLYLSNEMEDIIDLTTTKLPPPRSRHLANYVGAIVLVDEDNMYYSDFSVGGNIEVFTPFDTFKFGNTSKGPITGMFTNETFLVGYREFEAYYITGNIFTRNYRIQSYKSTRIGCLDPRSIVEYKGAGITVCEKGVFVASQGASMQEISDIIDPMFSSSHGGLNLDSSICKAVVDFKRDYIYFSFPTYTLAFNYYYNEWFVWDYVKTSGGLLVLNNSLYSSDGVNIFIENHGSSIAAESRYRSNFETLGTPSFLKKFLQVLFFTTKSSVFTNIGVKTYKNWDESTVLTDETKGVESSDTDIVQRFNPDRSKSVAIELLSASGEELILDGYEYEFLDDVGSFKSDN